MDVKHSLLHTVVALGGSATRACKSVGRVQAAACPVRVVPLFTRDLTA
jgi:hypothetical protein